MGRPTDAADLSTSGAVGPRALRKRPSGTLWKCAAFGLCVLALQVWAAVAVVERTKELRDLLVESHVMINRLERRIGYGGLIHNFKNYLLRPEEERYARAARSDARKALALIERLRQSATLLGSSAPLGQLQEMIEGYDARLDRVRDLAAQGLQPRAIDRNVRFDDWPALRELNDVQTTLNVVVDRRIASLQRDGAIAIALCIVITAVLIFLAMRFVARRQDEHLEATTALAERLAGSNEELCRANVALGQFAGIVSHDLKTPLRHIDFFGSMIEEDAANGEAVDVHAAGIRRLVGKMDTIIESLLDFAETGFTSPRREPVDLASLLGDALHDLRSDLREHGARVKFDIEPGLSLDADRALLARVFTNLLCNCIKYARDDEPPRIAVLARRERDQVRIAVSDNGIGIHPRFADKIFEPLQRLHGAHEPYEGVGIGLSLSKSIVEGHGGRIWLDATEAGNGTCIAFTLPLTDVGGGEAVGHRKAA